MGKFRIEPHGRLQEWVAEEKGYFRDEGLDYEFLMSYATQASGYALVQSSESAAPEARRVQFHDLGPVLLVIIELEIAVEDTLGALGTCAQEVGQAGVVGGAHQFAGQAGDQVVLVREPGHGRRP